MSSFLQPLSHFIRSQLSHKSSSKTENGSHHRPGQTFLCVIFISYVALISANLNAVSTLETHVGSLAHPVVSISSIDSVSNEGVNHQNDVDDISHITPSVINKHGRTRRDQPSLLRGAQQRSSDSSPRNFLFNLIAPFFFPSSYAASSSSSQRNHKTISQKGVKRYKRSRRRRQKSSPLTFQTPPQTHTSDHQRNGQLNTGRIDYLHDQVFQPTRPQEEWTHPSPYLETTRYVKQESRQRDQRSLFSSNPPIVGYSGEAYVSSRGDNTNVNTGGTRQGRTLYSNAAKRRRKTTPRTSSSTRMQIPWVYSGHSGEFSPSNKQHEREWTGAKIADTYIVYGKTTDNDDTVDMNSDSKNSIVRSSQDASYDIRHSRRHDDHVMNDLMYVDSSRHAYDVPKTSEGQKGPQKVLRISQPKKKSSSSSSTVKCEVKSNNGFVNGEYDCMYTPSCLSRGGLPVAAGCGVNSLFSCCVLLLTSLSPTTTSSSAVMTTSPSIINGGSKAGGVSRDYVRLSNLKDDVLKENIMNDQKNEEKKKNKRTTRKFQDQTTTTTTLSMMAPSPTLSTFDALRHDIKKHQSPITSYYNYNTRPVILSSRNWSYPNNNKNYVGGGTSNISPFLNRRKSRKFINKDRVRKVFHNEPQCGLPQHHTFSKRIIGGSKTKFAELPWQVHIRISSYQCGGVLLNEWYIATAAHCVHQAKLKQISVHLGEYDTKNTKETYEPLDSEEYKVVSVKLHPRFRYMLTQPDRFDIALMKLNRPVEYKPNILPICLPTTSPNYQLEGRIGVVAGWGKTDNSVHGRTGTHLLHKVHVPIISNNECRKWHRDKSIAVSLYDEMFCAGHKSGQRDACLGDSGGPLVSNINGRWTLVGITSAGFGCAVDKQPGIYHKVSRTARWIAHMISKKN